MTIARRLGGKVDPRYAAGELWPGRGAFRIALRRGPLVHGFLAGKPVSWPVAASPRRLVTPLIPGCRTKTVIPGCAARREPSIQAFARQHLDSGFACRARARE